MNIGIDIDGVLTNDDEYMMDTTSKYRYNEYRYFNHISYSCRPLFLCTIFIMV